MSHYPYITIFLTIIGWFVWRLYSNRHTLPCPAWLSWIIELDNPFASAHKASEIIKTISIQKDMKILDIGCGPGRVLLPLAQKITEVNGHITGLDIQAEMLAKTLTKTKKLNISNIDFIHGNIDQVPINQNFDIVLMICVLGEIPKNSQESIMMKVGTHLQPNGIISITETIFDPPFQTHQTIVELMEKIGLMETKFIENWLAYTAQFRHKIV